MMIAAGWNTAFAMETKGMPPLGGHRPEKDKEREQMRYEPPPLEVFLTRLAFRFYGKSVYRAYANRLPLRGDERVLDFGSGLGTVAAYVAPRLPKGQLVCADISARWMAACHKTLRAYPGVAFYRGDAYGLPLANGSFDLVYCHFVLHDIPREELEKVIPALAALLKEGGGLAFREPLDREEPLRLIQRLLEENGLARQDSRVTDVPVMGNSLESLYRKERGWS